MQRSRKRFKVSRRENGARCTNVRPNWPEQLSWTEAGFGGKKWRMWMRCCPICRRILKKFRLCDHIRCECGWEW